MQKFNQVEKIELRSSDVAEEQWAYVQVSDFEPKREISLQCLGKVLSIAEKDGTHLVQVLTPYGDTSHVYVTENLTTEVPEELLNSLGGIITHGLH